ncbi:MAG: hypothetical protein WD851_12210 [Pirellulales bacterium]
MKPSTKKLTFRIEVTAPANLDPNEVGGLLNQLIKVGYAEAVDSCDEDSEYLAELARLATSLDIGEPVLEETP